MESTKLELAGHEHTKKQPKSKYSVATISSSYIVEDTKSDNECEVFNVPAKITRYRCRYLFLVLSLISLTLLLIGLTVAILDNHEGKFHKMLGDKVSVNCFCKCTLYHGI